MKKTYGKLLSLLLASAMLVTAAGCAGGSTDNGAGSAATAQEGTVAQGDDAPAAADGEAVELSIWHIWPDPTDSSVKIIEDFVASYEAENPHVKIAIDATQQDEYQQRKLKVAASTGSQGDLFYTWGAGYSQQFIDAGAALALDDYFAADNTYDRLLDGVMDYFTYDGQVYGIPCKNWAGVLFCNTELFEAHGVDYPDTWEELIAAVRAFRAEGVTPMALGAKDAWHIGMYHNAIALRTAGADYCNEALQGRASLNTAEIVESARLMKELYDEDAFMNGTLGVTYDEAQMEFFMGLVPMYYSGSWTAGDVDNPENDVQGIIKVLPMPTVPGGKGDATTHLGGVIEGYMVNANTQNPDEAVRLAIALTEYQSQQSYINGSGIPAWKTDVDESEISPTLVEIKKITDNATGFVLAWDTFLAGSAIDAHYNLLQGLLGGSVSPEAFAEQMEEANQAYLAEREE